MKRTDNFCLNNYIIHKYTPLINFDRISNIQNVNKLSSYQYDDFGRLIRENNEALDKTIVYEYNDIGNITSKKTYDYTIATTPTTLLSTIPYEYDTTQKDRLISYNNTSIPYNVLGCPTKEKGYEKAKAFKAFEFAAQKKADSIIAEANTYKIASIREADAYWDHVRGKVREMMQQEIPNGKYPAESKGKAES